MVRPTVNSQKHILQSSLFSVAGTSIVNVVPLIVDESPAGTQQVAVGTTVKAIYCEYWVQGEATQPTTVNITVEKLESGAANMTFIQSQDLFGYSNKKNIFYTTQGIVGDANSNPIPFLRMWIKIPKGKQRFGLGDSLVVNIACITPDPDGLEVCGMALYKAYN